MKFFRSIKFYFSFTYALLVHFIPHIRKCIKSGKYSSEESKIIQKYWSKNR